MLDLGEVLTRFEMTFRDIGRVQLSIHEYVIPGLIFWWAAYGYLLIPLVRQTELRVQTTYHATVAELLMFDDLTNEKTRLVHFFLIFASKPRSLVAGFQITLD